MLLNKKTKKISQWLSITERTVLQVGSTAPETYHSVKLADYVSVIALDENGCIPLVRQYRPAVDDWTIELPSGLLEVDETPESCAKRELIEETGLTLSSQIKPLACLLPDTGRLENRLWGFFANVQGPALPDWCPESGVEPIIVTRSELRRMILKGEFNHALHVALVGIALVKGHFRF